jgi:hypothetical protein
LPQLRTGLFSAPSVDNDQLPATKDCFRLASSHALSAWQKRKRKGYFRMIPGSAR